MVWTSSVARPSLKVIDLVTTTLLACLLAVFRQIDDFILIEEFSDYLSSSISE